MDIAGPQDGIEPLRRICKWILEEEADPAALEALRAPDQIVGAAQAALTSMRTVE